MNVLSNCLHIPETGHVTIMEKDCRLVSLPLPTYSQEGISPHDLSDTLAFVNTQKTSNSNGNISDFILSPNSSVLAATQTQINSSFQDAATNTSLSLSGAADPSPFVERDENPWKRAWISFRSGRDIVSILNRLSSSLIAAPRQREVLAGKTAYNLAICISFCESVYRFFSPQLGFGLSVSQQLEQFSSLPIQTGSVRCVAWHPYLSLLALALIDNVIHLQNLHTPDTPLGSLRHRYQRHITCLQFSKVTGTQLAVGCVGGILVWFIEHSALLKGTSTYPTKWYPYFNKSPVLSLSWSPNQTLLSACSSATRHIMLVDTPTGLSQPVSRMMTRGICLLEWSPDGSKLLAASCAPSFRVWSADTWTPELWDGMSDRIQTAQWSPDGSILLFAIRKEPYLYSLTFSGGDSVDTSIREGVGGSKSAVKCVDLTPVLCAGNGGTEMEIGGCIQQIAWDSRGERLALLFSSESTVSAQELVLILRTKSSPVLSITPVGFIRGPPMSVPLIIAFRPISDTGATLLVVWNSGYVSLIPFDYNSRVNFDTPGESKRVTSTPVCHTSQFLSFSRQQNTPHPVLFSPVMAKSSPNF